MYCNFKGIYAANIVPLKVDKSIDTENLVNHVKEISNVKGIRGLLVNGHAGENFTLSANEQIQVLKIIKESIKKKSLIISGVNFEDPQEAARVANEMLISGANAILIFPPFSWSQGINTKMVYEHHKIISEAIQGPIFIYQSSVNSGYLSYKKETLRELTKLKNIIGIKEGSWNTQSYVDNHKFLKNINQNFLVMASGDEHIYPCFKYASDGSQVSLAAIVPEKIVELITNIENKNFDLAADLDRKLLILSQNIYGKYPPSFATARIKYCLEVLKKIPRGTMRSSISLDNEEKSQLKNSLKSIGMKI
tara:strand:- start:671 stop:1591 length:921 start_codon:yes stop_codon:yes gene_type:complete